VFEPRFKSCSRKKRYSMKNYLLILISLCFAFTAFGKKIYTLSKEDFAKQFQDSFSLDRIYCHNENGTKVWLDFNQNSILIARFNDNQEKKWILKSIKYVLGEIQTQVLKSTNSFNEKMAHYHQKAFKMYHFPIKDLLEIKLLKTGGYSFQTIKQQDCQILIRERNKEIDHAPIWYSFEERSGAIGFYRSWLTEGGFTGIKEEEGKPIYYER
jgi:hypothetical protein